MKEDCLFCKIGNGDIESKIVYEDEYIIAFLDINPNNTGHTLVVPKKHILNLTDMDNETFVHINYSMKIVYDKLKKKLNFDGLQLSQNNGILQEVKHYHIHMIPAYNKVKPNLSVDEVYELLKND